MFIWFRKYTSWYDIVDWGKFGQLRDFCNFWTRELHLNSYYGGWPGNLLTTFGCPAETVDLRSTWDCQEFLKNFVIFWLFRNFWGKFGHP